MHRMSWPDERALYYEWDAQIGADNSLVFDGEPVFVIRPDALWGTIEHVDYFHGVRVTQFAGVKHGRIVGQMVFDERQFCSCDVISARRGLVVTAVTAVQRTFRRKRGLRYVPAPAAAVWRSLIVPPIGRCGPIDPEWLNEARGAPPPRLSSD